jgi:predicted nucleic acid-binding protein
VVESDILIDFLEGVEGARSALEDAADAGVLHLSAVSAAQVMAASSGEAQERTRGLIESFEVVPVDREVALLAGRYFTDGGRGEPGLDDCIVAATCDRLAAVLVTRGRRRYPVGGFETMAFDY